MRKAGSRGMGWDGWVDKDKDEDKDKDKTWTWTCAVGDRD
jgi:hypothetical protein